MARSLATSRPLLAARVLAGVVAGSALVLGASRGPGTASAGPLEDGAAVLLDPRSSTAGRVAACQGIAEASADKPRHDRALAALVPALADPEADVRAAAARALGRVHDARAVPALTERLGREGDEVVLTLVLLAIGRVGGASEVPSVTALRGHRSARVRAAVATTLGDLGGAEAREGLLRLLASPGVDEAWAVRGAALLALARVGRPEDAGAILVAYRDGDGASQWFARVALANAVAALDPDPMTVLDRLVADPDPRVSTAAAVALVRRGREAEVVRRLSDARPGVRSASGVALAQTERREHVPRLLSLAAADPDPGVRWSVTLALSRLDVPEADALVLAGVSSDDPEIWSTALAECRRKTGLALPRDADACRAALAARRRGR